MSGAIAPCTLGCSVRSSRWIDADNSRMANAARRSSSVARLAPNAVARATAAESLRLGGKRKFCAAAAQAQPMRRQMLAHDVRCTNPPYVIATPRLQRRRSLAGANVPIKVTLVSLRAASLVLTPWLPLPRLGVLTP